MAKQRKNEVTMTKLHQSKNLKKWKADNAVHLATTFGVDDGPHVSFVTGMRDSYHRANVELKGNKFIPISSDSVDKKKLGGRKQAKNCLFHTDYPGFSPSSWEHVITPNMSVSFSIEVIGNDAVTSSVIHIHRPVIPTKVLNRLTNRAASIVDMYGSVRPNDGVGKMVGFGDHLHNGQLKKFALSASDDTKNCCVPNIIQDVGNIFEQQFTSLDCGFQEMMTLQSELWPDGTTHIPQCWVASCSLGNSMHVDNDGSRSFAMWLCSDNTHPSVSGGVNFDAHTHQWWFLLPKHDVAIALTSGTFISWDGRLVEHCTSVPTISSDSIRLLSFFTAIPQNLVNVLSHEKVCKQILKDRKSTNHESILNLLSVGSAVTYRHVPSPSSSGLSAGQLVRWGYKYSRWVRAKVHSIDPLMGVTLEEVYPCRILHPPLSEVDLDNWVVIGHY